MDASDSAGQGRPWDLVFFKDSNGQPFILAADIHRCCSAHSGKDDQTWDDQIAWNNASTAISRYARADSNLKELVSKQTPDHAGRALTSVAEFDYLLSKIKDSMGHKGRFISAWRARIVAFLPLISPLPRLAILFPAIAAPTPLLLPLLPPPPRGAAAAAGEGDMEEFLSARCGLHDVVRVREKDGSSTFMASASSWDHWESARDLLQLCTCSQYSRKRHCYARDRSGVKLYYLCHCGGKPDWTSTTSTTDATVPAAKKRPGAAGMSKRVGCTASLLAVVSTPYAFQLGLTTTESLPGDGSPSPPPTIWTPPRLPSASLSSWGTRVTSRGPRLTSPPSLSTPRWQQGLRSSLGPIPLSACLDS